jgi:amino acid adenylation domain-containing protein
MTASVLNISDHSFATGPRPLSDSLATGFARSCELHPDRLALEVNGTSFSYRSLHNYALRIANVIRPEISSNHEPLVAVFAYRSLPSFSGILAALFSGAGYVPLNPRFPIERTRLMLSASRCRLIIADSAGEAQLEDLLESESPLTVVLPEQPDPTLLTTRHPRHRFIGALELESQPTVLKSITKPRPSIAYLLFTSGSTGQPKGVKVADANVIQFVNSAVTRYQITESDRLSQNFDMTFDLSAFDMFVAWERGACVCCPPQKTLLNPAGFIRNSRLTVWFSVPSLGSTMSRLGALRPRAFPDLRWSLFCGEPLSRDIAETWSAAAPNSIVENLYGPTEATIACTAYRWDPQSSPSECDRGIVPIGHPLADMCVLVADEGLREVAPGEAGELLLSGPQISMGYWEDRDRTAARFVIPPGRTEPHYRTGDRVRRPLNNGPITFLGRSDNQIKVQGYRVELEEVEAWLRREAKVKVAVAVGWPITASGPSGIEAFVSESPMTTEEILRGLKSILPRYALPRRVHRLDNWPLNSNGKIDRRKLLSYLEETA